MRLTACCALPLTPAAVPAQVAAFLEQSSRLFERTLDAEDAMDGAAVEGILAEVRTGGGLGGVDERERLCHGWGSGGGNPGQGALALTVVVN